MEHWRARQGDGVQPLRLQRQRHHVRHELHEQPRLRARFHLHDDDVSMTPVPKSSRLAPAALLLAALLAMACSTEEDVQFGDPGRVTGGFGHRASTGAAGNCVENFACSVSWQGDIYSSIFTAPVGGNAPSGGCGESGCHLEGAGGLTFPPDNADEAYFQLKDYQLAGGRAYVVPCEPSLSHIMCNLKFAPGVDNAFVGDDQNFSGGCGSPMPKSTDLLQLEPLNQQQLDTIVEWIVCGAPQN
jgi:hypothetical protein